MASSGAPRRQPEEFDYDVALSFAGENRPYVSAVAAELRSIGVRPFYDEYEKANLWGKDLYSHLDWVYRRAARYCVLFVSEAYAAKVWTNHERSSAQARAIANNEEYILPVRFDDTEVPGLRQTIGYIDLRSTGPEELAELIVEKLGPRTRRNFLPPNPDLLYESLKVEGEPAQQRIRRQAQQFLHSLSRMSEDERRVVTVSLLAGCTTSLPESVHISLDLLRREVEMPPAEVLSLLRGVSSLGIDASIGTLSDHMYEDSDEKEELVFVEWHDLVIYEDDEDHDGNGTQTAVQMLKLVYDQACSHCATEALERLDFAVLARATHPDQDN